MSTKGPAITPKPNIAPSPPALGSATSPPSQGRSSNNGVSGGGSDVLNGIAKSTGAVKQIITSKEWVLPPRPKPGRKPSVDTPASKRKAQNRAAQRAFRERRATRVQELEEKLMEVEKEKEVKEMGLVNTISRLKSDNQFLLKSLEQIRSDLNELRQPESSKFQLESHQTLPRPLFNTNSPGNQSGQSPASSSYSVQQLSPAPSVDSPPIVGTMRHGYSLRSSNNNNNNNNNSSFTPLTSSHSPDRLNGHERNMLEDSNFDCGVCQKEECLCETVGLKSSNPKVNAKITLEETLRTFSPKEAVPLRKKRKIEEQNSEIDFTNQFAIKKTISEVRIKRRESNSNNQIFASLLKRDDNSGKFNASSPVENCGFCSDDTPCVCREAAKEAARLNDSLNQDLTEDVEAKPALPPIQLNTDTIPKVPLPVMHPGPSVEIRDITNLTPGAVPTVVNPTTRSNGSVVATPCDTGDADSIKTQEPSKKPSGCTGNPGTCEQCQMDPMSTLFCTTVASKIGKESASSPVSASSSSTPNGSVSTIASDQRRDLASSNTTTPSGIFIPCSDAYKTLSRHKKFNSVDFSTLVGKLTTRGMQVEVQSVANVLRELDRRLYN
ncbi:uncharacterized protein PRCAT00002555001 [Priceomyces carsonii]|uniref:uncharacterized protein n=1 Tax=Priceomyces carsonii TaxID=28549 RepID=UPI002ED9E408|nr:unnamed protein product [Priceomyces carsonii]